MSTDFSIRPVGAPAGTPVIQPLSDAAVSAVATELPASQSVTAVDASVAVRNDTQAALSDYVSHQAFIDQAAASIVYQVVDSRTQAVVAQYPEEAVLRRRAYFHTLDLTKGEPTRILATDRKA
jgi:hypothetical protein